jgi:hypothetical protein
MASAPHTEQWTAVKVRDTFLQYFEKHGHTFGMFTWWPEFDAKLRYEKCLRLLWSRYQIRLSSSLMLE